MAMQHTERPGALHAAVATYTETQRLSISWGIAPSSYSITAGFLASDLCFVVRLRLTDKIVFNAVQVPPPPPSSHVWITLKSVRMYVQSGHIVLMFRFTERTSQIIWVGLR